MMAEPQTAVEVAKIFLKRVRRSLFLASAGAR
jgi:hypothetical protein